MHIDSNKTKTMIVMNGPHVWHAYKLLISILFRTKNVEPLVSVDEEQMMPEVHSSPVDPGTPEQRPTYEEEDDMR